MTDPTTITITTDEAHHLLDLLERRIEDLAQLVGRPTDDEVLRPGMLAMFRRGLDEDADVYDRVMNLVIEAEEGPQ